MIRKVLMTIWLVGGVFIISADTVEVSCVVDTLFSVKFADDVCLRAPVSVGEVGAVHFAIDSALNFYLYDKLSKRISRRKTTGEVLICRPLAHEFDCMGCYDNVLYVFDGQDQYSYSIKDLSLISKRKLLTADDSVIVSGISFYYKNFLFIGDFSAQDSKSHLYYVFDNLTNELSRKISNESGFIPLTNCDACDINFLSQLFYPPKRPDKRPAFCNFRCQSDNKLLYKCTEIMRGQRKFSEEYFVYDKRSGSHLRLNVGNALRPVGGYYDVHFVGDSTIIMQCLRQEKTKNGLESTGIQYCRVRF